MMSRLRYWIMDPIYFFFGRLRYMLTDPRMLIVAGIVVMGILFAVGGNTLKMIAFWIGIVLVAALIVVLVLWLLRRAHARHASAQLGDEMAKPSEADKTMARSAGHDTGDVDVLRQRLHEAVKTIKTSRLGRTRGTEALYELPWYMIIGNPAAGKSTAIVNSGLRFPFADSQGSIVQGIGGTRNCDWYFTTEGILLDTAGRYSVDSDNRSEWLSFLELLRKNRPRAPINGILIAASIPELTGNPPEFAINLAKKLRQRVQELTDWLEVIPPVYVIFTKADLIDGFNDFFHTLEDGERQRVWGATLPFKPDQAADPDEQFDRYFDELSEGLKEMSLSQMSLNRGSTLAPGMLTLPLEFTSIKATLRTFITTLFEDNPFQFRPVFRGFYFTSALQETASTHHASERIAQRYGLAAAEPAVASGTPASAKSYFLLDLFRKVIFADKQLVRQYSSRNRKHTRYAVLLGSALVLGLALAGWAWSYTNNRQLVVNVQADLDKVVSLQKGRIDLQSRLEALQILQDRLQQLQQYRHDHPLMLGLGLYQGGTIESQVRREYFNGMRQLMLVPVTRNLEAYLKQVVLHGSELTQAKPDATQPSKAHGTYLPPSPTSTEEAYNALKAYLMLADPKRVEPVQLSDQLTRFWRGWLDSNRGLMTRDQLIGSADHLLGFYVTQYDKPGWPTVDDKDALVDDTRQALRSVMRGMPAINRVYAEIKARSATRFPAVSVASIVGDGGDKVVLGSYAIPGTFTRAAWTGYVKDAIRDAANHQLSTTDWVLQTTQQTDLTLSGSPEQIQKQLETLYDKDYVAQWRKFLQGVSIAPFGSFSDAVNGMNTLGDPQDSPLRTLMDRVYAETAWDNPSTVSQGLGSAKGGFTSWFKRVILRRAPPGINADSLKLAGSRAGSSTGAAGLQYGPIGQAFTGVARLMIARDNNPALFQNYMDMLGKLRTRLDAIKNLGDPGPGALKLMQQTLDSSGSGSDLSAGLQLVDGQMLNGLDAAQRGALRPLLLRPLMQTFASLIQPAEAEINKTWSDQVYTPFEKNLARKSPFNPNGQVQAVDSEIAQVFGPSGAISNFAGSTLGPLVNRRGDTLTARQWANMGLSLSPQLMAGFAQWVAPLGQTTGGGGQTVFQIQPEPGSGGISEYTIDINGQTLRYRNTPPAWQSFAWDAAQPNPVAKVSAVTYDGRNVTIVSFSGSGALSQLFRAAKGGRDPATGVYNLTWSQGPINVSVQLKLVSGANTNANGSQKQGLDGATLPAAVVGTGEPAAASSTPGTSAPPAPDTTEGNS